MSRFVLGNCIDVMTRIPDNAIDFILTDPPYLVGFRDRSGRTIAGDKTDEWLQPACNEMYRVLKKDALMVSFYGWNRVDRFMAAWKNAGFSVVGHLVFTKNYTSKAAYLRENFNGVRVQCGDFMEWQPVQYYSRVIMNPPFSHGQDIRHILRAFSLLRPGGVLVAVCLNGPRQQEKLLPFSDVREELPRGTFAYTDVPTMIIRLRA
ncbi:TPA: DNA methyltransferase [Escherichia coli]